MEQTPPKRSLISTIFLSPNEPRLRAGWRFLIQSVLFIVLMIVLSIPVGLIAFYAHGNVSGTAYFIVNMLVELLGITVSVYIARRFLDKRSFKSLGFKLDKLVLLDILAGIVVTFVMMGSIFVMMQSLGWLKFESFAWTSEPVSNVILQTALFFFIFIIVGWNEELLFRGYQLQTIASGMNLFWGVVLSSIIFGLMHLGNLNAVWVSAVGIFFAGLFLAYGYVRTKQLWLSIGLHIGWNFFEGVVFGFPVSGLDIYPLTHIQVSGPEIWTGGAFGPEAGLIVLPALALGTVLIYLYTRSRISR